MKKKMTSQAEGIQKEFPTISEDSINLLDNDIKQKINSYNSADAFEEISVFIQEKLKPYLTTKNKKKIKNKMYDLFHLE